MFLISIIAASGIFAITKLGGITGAQIADTTDLTFISGTPDDLVYDPISGQLIHPARGENHDPKTPIPPAQKKEPGYEPFEPGGGALPIVTTPGNPPLDSSVNPDDISTDIIPGDPPVYRLYKDQNGNGKYDAGEPYSDNTMYVVQQPDDSSTESSAPPSSSTDQGTDRGNNDDTASASDENSFESQLSPDQLAEFTRLKEKMLKEGYEPCCPDWEIFFAGEICFCRRSPAAPSDGSAGMAFSNPSSASSRSSYSTRYKLVAVIGVLAILAIVLLIGWIGWKSQHKKQGKK